MLELTDYSRDFGHLCSCFCGLRCCSSWSREDINSCGFSNGVGAGFDGNDICTWPCFWWAFQPCSYHWLCSSSKNSTRSRKNIICTRNLDCSVVSNHLFCNIGIVLQVPLYVLSQFLGSTLACLTLKVLFNDQADILPTLTHYSSSTTDLEAITWEFVITFIFMLTIRGVASDDRAVCISRCDTSIFSSCMVLSKRYWYFSTIFFHNL